MFYIPHSSLVSFSLSIINMLLKFLVNLYLMSFQQLPLSFESMFVPTIDGKFLVADPEESIKGGDYNDVSMIVGYNENEGTRLCNA